MILQFIANGLVAGAVYSIVALGFGLIYNTTRILHIAHGATYITSAYIFFTFYRVLNFHVGASIAFGLLACIALGVLMEIVVYRPLYKRKACTGVAIVSSIGIYIFIVNLIAMLYGNETKILSPGIEKTYEIGSIILTRVQVLELGIFVFMFLFYLLLLKKTNFGKLIRALADNPVLLSTFGVGASGMRMWIFALGSLFAGVASCLVALDVGMDPNVGMSALLASAVAVIIGGIGIFEGAVIGGFTIGLLQNLVVWKMSARWQETVTFALLLLFLLLRPQGLLGKRRRAEEL